MNRFEYAIWAILVIVTATVLNAGGCSDDSSRGWGGGRSGWDGGGGHK